MEPKLLDNDWNTLMQFFPEGWEDKAKELGALTRRRKFKSPSELLRVLLVHLADGCSMRETAVRAGHSGMVSISDVAILKKIKKSSDWFKWMSNKLLRGRRLSITPPDWVSKYKVRSVDASVITEPGSTGTDWRLHYSLELFSLNCDQFIVSKPVKGESFLNFDIEKNDLLIGDRAYGRYKGFKYVKENGADFLARYKHKAFTVYDKAGEKANLPAILKKLKIGEILDLSVDVAVKSEKKLSVRICAIKKSKKEADLAKKKTIYEQKRKQRKINPETLGLNNYVIIVTSLPDKVSARRIMELYRTRWQVEISFKQLKSIFGLGHLPKFDEDSSRAWLHGKMFVALLAQSIVEEGRFFSPWGYPAQCLERREQKLVAGTVGSLAPG